MLKRTAAGIGYTAALLAMLGGCTVMTQYESCFWGRHAGHTRGDVKNTIATFVTAAVANKIAPDSATIDVLAEKYFWPNARIHGNAAGRYIDTNTDLWLSHMKFHGVRRSDGMLLGEIDKPGLDWTIDQRTKDIYDLKAFWYFAAGQVRLSVDRGYIDGEWGAWPITGRYTEKGDFTAVIDPGDRFNVVLKGKITKK